MGDASFTSLTTARLVIRRFTLDDVAVFAGYRSDPDVARYQSWSAPYPVESARPFIESLAAANPDEPGGWFLQRVGFRLEGHLVESYWDGAEWTDDLRFGLLRREWSQRATSGTRG